jgi:hypothetical protein
MSNSFTNQVLAQIELWKNGEQYENKVYVLPKHLDEKVARLHLDRIGARLTPLSDEQADYIGVPKEGPYTPDSYRYETACGNCPRTRTVAIIVSVDSARGRGKFKVQLIPCGSCI